MREVTFCVVDLETTGGSAAAGAKITEIGAVRVCGGEVEAEYGTLVQPGEPIPAFIAVLTGITDAMVADAPPIAAVLPSFLEFSAGSVLVAHNAPFDIGFLRHFASELGHRWPGFEVLDTARVARRVLTRDEAPDCKLATLARVLHAATIPNHRALADARATVDVLHALVERLGNLGVHTLEELQTYSSRVSPAQRRKRHLAEHLPHAPGVYVFHDQAGRPLYIGTSRDLRSRVRSYFTASETRSRMGEMVGVAAGVEGIVCATVLEAQVRELRLIAKHKPRYNRRSRHPERGVWVKLTVEPWPRLSLVRQVLDDGACYVGPFSARRIAERAVDALHDTFSIRQCSGRLPRHPTKVACALAEMGRCMSPCDGSADPEAYATQVQEVRACLVADPAPVLGALSRAMSSLSEQQRYEDAARRRERLSAFVRGTARSQRVSALTGCPQVVAARDVGAGAWEVHVLRFGRLAAAGVLAAGVEPATFVTTLVAGAETVLPGPGPTPAASLGETETVLRWLESDGVRLIEVDGEWSCPLGGAGRVASALEPAAQTRAVLEPFDERRLLATVHRPPR